MPNTDDLRYVRTEASIRAAFMELVQEMPVASVTASAICRRATISRNAFYLHHASVAELYAALVGELVDDVRTESLASADKRVVLGRDDDFSLSILQALARHESLLRTFLPADDGSLAKCLAESIEEAFVEAALRFGEHGGSPEHRLSCAYSAWATVGFAARWIAQSKRPLIEGAEHFASLGASAAEISSAFLLQGR